MKIKPVEAAALCAAAVFVAASAMYSAACRAPDMNLAFSSAGAEPVAAAVRISAGEHYIGGRLDINLATARELIDLPGVGEAIAGRIIEYREKNGGFEQVSELLEIDGIGTEKMNVLSEYITLTDLEDNINEDSGS